ncbi:unnamed protein product [Schistocephalus solidus]|uniref:ThiF domain-containing protein n=1 Tax=Schistocephalus solidus TaxID=70667 RepID=A0A183TPV5_SCHSO|nr:unnamed protein product [Schistocephalus solidus]
MDNIIVDFDASGESAAQVRDCIHRFQLGAIDIDVSCGVEGIGRWLMHQNRFLRVDAKSEVVIGGSEEVYAPSNFLFCRCIECTVVSEEMFVDGGCSGPNARHNYVVKLTHHARESLRTDEFLRDFPQPVAIHNVKDFRQDHEVSVEVNPQVLALLLQLASAEDHVDFSSGLSEAIVAFREQSLLQVMPPITG